MDEMPKRRKSKDNPYILSKDENNNIYLVSFVDGTNTYRSVKITKEIYDAMNSFELKDLSQMNEYDNHIEHSEVYENTLNIRTMDKLISLEDSIIFKATLEELKEAINMLPDAQKRRIKKYYFDEMNETEIAKQEGISQKNVSKSINAAKNNLKKFLKILN